MMLRRGITYFHEHMLFDVSPYNDNKSLPLRDFSKTMMELRELYLFGVRTLIDLTTPEFGRNFSYIESMALATGIEILPSTGFGAQRFLPSQNREWGVDEYAQFMIHELTTPAIGSQIRAKVIGELVVMNAALSPYEQEVLSAAVIASKQTNAPIMCHVATLQSAQALIEFLQEKKFNLSHLAVVGMYFDDDIEMIRAILKTGASIQFNATKGLETISFKRISSMLSSIEKDRYQQQIMISMNIFHASQLKANGGIGYAYLLQEFASQLERHPQVGSRYVEQILMDNPIRFFRNIKSSLVKSA
jgi:phosphotriesterase-related protein